MVTFNFGYTFSQQPVSALMAKAFPVTIKLALMALLIEAIFGIGVGVIAGLRRGGIFDSTVLVASLVVIAIPIFVLGFTMQWLFGIKLGWSPADGRCRSDLLQAAAAGDRARRPVSMAYVLRLTRQSVSDNLTADFVRTARAKGISNSRTDQRARAAQLADPGGHLPRAPTSGALMARRDRHRGHLQRPGRRPAALPRRSSRARSTTVVAVVTALVMIYVVANLIVDLLYAVLDPRIRYV